MRTYITSILMGLCIISLTWGGVYSVFYDDLTARDLQDNTIVASGSNQSVPVSKPLVLGDDIMPLSDATGSINKTSDDTLQLIDDLQAPNTTAINQLPEFERDAEFLMSLRWLYDQGLTKFQDPEQYMPENYLSRVDASKMLSILSRKVFGLTKTNDDVCAYTDIVTFDAVTQGQIKDSCKLGIFRSASLFNPNQGITKGQLITVLIRMFDGKKLDENTDPWYKNYIQRAREIGLIQDRSTAGMDDTMSRMDVAKMLYKLRNIHLNKTPVTTNDSPLFIHIITNSGGGKLYQALIDVGMIRDDYLETLEMKLDTVTYYFGKTKIYNYGATLSNFQVYGYIYASSESITPIGVGTRRVQKGIIQEGSLVIWGTPQTVYTITPSQDASLYIITKSE